MVLWRPVVNPEPGGWCKTLLLTEMSAQSPSTSLMVTMMSRLTHDLGCAIASVIPFPALRPIQSRDLMAQTLQEQCR